MMWKSTLIALVLSLLPVTGDTKMHLSLLLTEVMGSVYLLRYVINKFGWFKSQEVTIGASTPSGGHNPIYDKFQEYLADKFKKHLTSYELIPRNGEVEFSLKDMQGKKFEDEFKGHKISLNIVESSVISVVSDGSSKSNKSIVVKSTTADSNTIKAYVQSIMRLKIDTRGLIRVYRPIVKGKKKDEQTIEWEVVNVQTSKSLANTVYSKSVDKELFQDIQHFMDNEKWYTSRGIPYKRGYVVHGVPGSGKTTISKILANMYDMPVFCLDLTTVKDNTTLITLMTELNNYVHYQKYILLMEDVERSDFFRDRYERNSKLTMDCLLNIIDGIVEPHGRIIIMSANNVSPLKNVSALMRPGRIDKIIEINYCTKYQVMKLYELFYSNHKYQPDWDKWDLHENLTAAFIMKLLQENVNNPQLFMHLVAEATEADNDDVELDESFKEAVDVAQKELVESQKKPLDQWGGRRSRSYGNRRRRGTDTKSRVRRTKQELKRCDTMVTRGTKRKALAESRLPKLLEKLKEEEAKKLTDKLKRKGEARAKWLKKNQMLVEDCSDEEEYETPAFLLNSIAASSVPANTTVTYETIEEPSDTEQVYDLFEQPVGIITRNNNLPVA